MKKPVHKSLNVPYINESLVHTKKLLITLGCSYTVGSGAVDQDILENHPIIYSSGQINLNLLDKDAQNNLVATRSSIYTRPNGGIDWNLMEHDNCYGNVLADKYLSGSYAFANMGRQAGGNYGPIARLMMYDINYDLAEKIVVIFMPSGMNRLEFLDDIMENRLAIGGDTKTFWPGLSVLSFSPGSAASDLCKNYLDIMHSDRFEIEKTILEFQILQQWCQVHGAELIVFPAFNKIYNKKYFIKTIQTASQRDKDHSFIKSYKFLSNDAVTRVNKIDWTKFVQPQACTNFYELCLRQEPVDYYRDEIDLHNLPPISPNKYMLPCGHPSAKAHDLMAQEFYKLLQDKGLT